MEKDDKVLKDLLKKDFNELKAPIDFTDKLMNQLENVAAKKAQPLVSFPIRLLFILLGIGFMSSVFFVGEVPANGWAEGLPISEWTDKTFLFLSENSEILALVGSIAVYLIIDGFRTQRKKVRI